MALASAAALSLLLSSAARSGDVEDVLRRVPLKGVQTQDPEKKDAPLPPGVPGARPAGGSPDVRPFVLKTVAIEGATAFSVDELRSAYDTYLMRTVAGSELAQIAEAITIKYREAGYFLSRAIIPAQDVADGRLRITIIEGYVSALSIDGDAGDLKPYADELLAERPAKIETLERTLYLMGDVAGVRFKASRMAPDGDDLARHRLIVTASVVPFDAMVYGDNRGKPDAGELQTYLRASASSLLQFGDKLSFGYFFVPDQLDELQFGELNYIAALGHDGATLTLNGSLSRNDQGDSGPGLDNKAESSRFFGQVSYPLMRSRAQSLWLHAGVERLHIRNEAAGALAYQDDLAMAHLAATFRQAVWSGLATIYAEISHGFIEAANVPHSTGDADGRFVKGFAQATIVQSLGSGFSVFAEVDGQISDRPLFTAEEFALGGSRIGRGYDTGEISGENGVGGVIELRYGAQVWDWLYGQIYGFYDAGIVWNDNVPPAFDDTMSLNSAGAGVRLTLPYQLYLTYEAAEPLTRTPAVPRDKDLRHFFSLSFSL